VWIIKICFQEYHLFSKYTSSILSFCVHIQLALILNFWECLVKYIFKSGDFSVEKF
jgi:hypothetical protein